MNLKDMLLARQYLASLQAQIDGSIDRMNYNVKGTGPDIEIKLAGAVSHAAVRDSLNIDKATVQIKGQRVALLHPAMLVRQGTALHVDKLVLSGGGGQAALTADLTPAANRANLEITHLALDQLSAVMPGLPIKGEMTALLTLDGPIRNPQAALDLHIAQLASTDVTTPPATATLTATWRNGRLDAAGDLKLGSQGEALTVSASLPIPADPATGFPRVDENTELAATAKGHIDLALANSLLPSSVDHIGGKADIDLAVAGSISVPKVQGRLVVADGRYENLRYGTRIKAIRATVTATGARLDLSDFSAKTPGNGSLSGSGDIDFTRSRPVAIKIQASNAQLIDNAMASAAANADLTVSSIDAHEIQLAGTVKIIKAEIRIPDRFASSVKEIAITERNTHAKMVATVSTTSSPAPSTATERPSRMSIDMDIDAPQQVAVRGRGLDAELGGKLHVVGDISQPVITGQLKLRHGKLDLVGRSLNFDHGVISFDGGTTIDPQLDFTAKTKANSYDITVTVGGTASKPVLSLTSTPTLPQDEILAQLLFGRAAGALTPLQAVQL